MAIHEIKDVHGNSCKSLSGDDAIKAIIPSWNSSTTDVPQINVEKDYKELAIVYTVEYFKNKQVSQEIFMRHLETVYNFLLDGKVSYK